MKEQDKFNALYITASEICERLSIVRSAVLYERRKGDMPESLRLNGVGEFFWVREQLEPYLENWEARLKKARSAA